MELILRENVRRFALKNAFAFQHITLKNERVERKVENSVTKSHNFEENLGEVLFST